MLDKVLIETITFYQRYISPHKGYCCAHRAYTGEDSCSQFTKMAIKNYGLISAFPLIRKQFNNCRFAADEIRKKQSKEKKSKSDTFSDCSAGCSSCDTCGTISHCNLFD